MFQCCPPKWGPWGMVWPRKLAKLMVMESLLTVWAPEAERGQGTECPQRSFDERGRRETLSVQTCGSSLPPDWASKMPWGHSTCSWGPSPKHSVPRQCVRPSFVQLMRASPSLSPADVGGRGVTGRGRAWGPWSLQRGTATSLDNRVCGTQSLVLVNG